MAPPNTTTNCLFTEELCKDYPVVKDLKLSKLPNTSPLPDYYTLPDLVEDCPYPHIRSHHEDTVARETDEWFLDVACYGPEKTTELLGLKAGILASACYPDADEFHLRTVADYLIHLFNIDDWMDDFDVRNTRDMQNTCIGAMEDPEGFQTEYKAGLMTKSYAARLAKTAGPGCLRRFIDNMSFFFDAVVIQSDDRKNGKIPTLEEYINVRRDTSGCKPCFQLIEFAGRFDLPQEVAENDKIQGMEQWTNDLVAWSNDIFSHNKEHIRNDNHSMVPIVMHHYGLNLQEAIDFVGKMCKQAIENFIRDRSMVPTGIWGEDVDEMVEKYAMGLQNWIVGSLHWSFGTERYFGKDGHEVKKHKIVQLPPKSSAKLPNHLLPLSSSICWNYLIFFLVFLLVNFFSN